jgi:hypothetical protein
MSGTYFDFNRMLNSLGTYCQNVQSYLAQLEQAGGSSGGVDMGTMFRMQFQMQIMSQYTEAVSNVLSAVHNEMVSMARATKGQ